MVSDEARTAAGKRLRRVVPREGARSVETGSGEADPLALLDEQNLPGSRSWCPVRMGRMAASPFAFLPGLPPLSWRPTWASTR